VAKILYAGDAFVQTGFGRVAEYLLPALAKEHDVHVLATNYHGDHDEEAIKYKPTQPWCMAPTHLAAIVLPN
jgi:hypothetical protein